MNAPLESADDARVRRSTLRIALWVAGASAAVLVAGVVIVVAVIFATSRPLGRGVPGPGGRGDTDADHLVVDVDRVLPWVIGLGLLGIVVMGFVAWLVARQAVAPLSEALRVQRRFVADAGHELRTPLTALHARVQTAQRRAHRGEDVTEVLASLRADADVMNAVLTDLLLASTAEPRSGERADLTLAVAEAARLLQPLAAEAGVTVLVDDRSPHAASQLSQAALTRMVVALVDNAVQHAPAGSPVEVQAWSHGRLACVRVRDSGSGIAGIAPDDVFVRFARGAESGRRRGFGIGLALVKELATRAGGDVTVERTGSDGTAFLLTLPRVDPPAGRSPQAVKAETGDV